MKRYWYTGEPVNTGWYLVYKDYVYEEQSLNSIHGVNYWNKDYGWLINKGFKTLYWTYLLDEPNAKPFNPTYRLPKIKEFVDGFEYEQSCKIVEANLAMYEEEDYSWVKAVFDTKDTCFDLQFIQHQLDSDLIRVKSIINN